MNLTTASSTSLATTVPICPWQGMTCQSWDIIFIFLLSRTVGEKVFNHTRSTIENATFFCHLAPDRDRMKIFRTKARDKFWSVSEEKFKKLLHEDILFNDSTVEIPEHVMYDGYISRDLWAALYDIKVSGSAGRGRAIVIISNLLHMEAEILNYIVNAGSLKNSLATAGVNPVRIIDLPLDPNKVEENRTAAIGFRNLSDFYYLVNDYADLEDFVHLMAPCDPQPVDLWTAEPSKKKNNNWLVGSLVSVGFLLFIIIFMGCLIAKKVKNFRRQKEVHRIQMNSLRKETETRTEVICLDAKNSRGWYKKKRKSKVDIWEVKREQLQICYNKKLGVGAFSEVYKGLLYESKRKHHHMEVAVKMLQRYKNHLNSDFLQEINFMKALGKHPNLLNIVAAITISEPLCLVVEYCAQGDLLQWVRDNKDEILNNENHSDPCMKTLFSFAWQVSDGLEYLSSKDVIHRDVAARNVLIDAELSAKVSDYGMCRHVESGVYIMEHGRMPIKWMAIESLESLIYSTKSDIWSFGVLLYEVFSFGKTPFPCIQPMDMVHHLKHGNRLEQPENCLDEIHLIMQKCWRELPENRPTFEEIRHELAEILDKETEQFGYLTILPS